MKNVKNNEQSNMEINKAINVLKSEDALERCDAITLLSNYISQDYVLNAIIERFQDRDYLVRCEAYEAVYSIISVEMLNNMISRLRKERSSVAKMYILSNICNIVKNSDCLGIKDELEDLFLRERSKRVIISYTPVLYILNNDIHFVKKALEYLDDPDYHIRCNVINSLDEVIDLNNINLIKSAYKKRLKFENAFAVSDLLNRSLENEHKGTVWGEPI